MKGAVTALRGLIPANSFEPHYSPKRWAALCKPSHLSVAPQPLLGVGQ